MTSRRLVRRLLPLVLAIPLIAVPVGGFLVLTGGSSPASLPVAQGAVGGVFHPIAGNFAPDDSSLSDCADDTACIEQAFGNLAYRRGAARALGLFESRIEADPVVEKDCHRIAHTIGSATLARNHGDVALTFSQGSPVCVSGYYHGILERAFIGVTTKRRLVDVARTLCTGAGLRRRGFLDYQCRHGLGHGLMLQTGYDLPMALSVCSRIGVEWDNVACASGAFMQNVDTRFGYRSAWLKDEDPVYPCERVPAPDVRSCYLRTSWRFLTLAGGDFARAGAGCSGLARWSTTCFQGLGRDAAEETRYDRPKILRLCGLMSGARDDCLLGAARTIANASGSAGIAPATALCRAAPRTAQGPCFYGAGLVVGLLEPTPFRRAALCGRISSTYRKACARAAEAEIDSSARRAWP